MQDAAEQKSMYWWHSSPMERFWIEIRKSDEKSGLELQCPFKDRRGHRNGWWELVDEVKSGDCIYHWSTNQARFVGRSFAAGSRRVDDETGDRVVPLKDFLPLTVDIGKDQYRALTPEFRAIRHALEQEYPRLKLFLPFADRSDGMRLVNNYFAKLPHSLQQKLFGIDGLAESGLPYLRGEDGPPILLDDEHNGRPGGYLSPFEPRADEYYTTHILGGPFQRGRTHETLVNEFAEWLNERGLLAASNAAIDLGLEQPPVIIEAKVVRSGRWATAIRQAVGQLYEYRYFQVVAPDSRLLFLASSEIPQKWLDYLDKVHEIGAVWCSSGGFQLSDRASIILEPLFNSND